MFSFEVDPLLNLFHKFWNGEMVCSDWLSARDFVERSVNDLAVDSLGGEMEVGDTWIEGGWWSGEDDNDDEGDDNDGQRF